MEKRKRGRPRKAEELREPDQDNRLDHQRRAELVEYVIRNMNGLTAETSVYYDLDDSRNDMIADALEFMLACSAETTADTVLTEAIRGQWRRGRKEREENSQRIKTGYDEMADKPPDYEYFATQIRRQAALADQDPKQLVDELTRRAFEIIRQSKPAE